MHAVLRIDGATGAVSNGTRAEVGNDHMVMIYRRQCCCTTAVACINEATANGGNGTRVVARSYGRKWRSCGTLQPRANGSIAVDRCSRYWCQGQSTQWREGGEGYAKLAPRTVGSTTTSDVHVLVHVYVYLVLCMCFINCNLRKMKDLIQNFKNMRRQTEK